MVREIVDKVRAAEKEADNIIAAAQADGALKLKEANEAAQLRKKDAVAKALADKEIRLDKKKKQLVGLEEKTENDIRNDAFAIKDKAADLYEETIELVMERIYSGR